jgi:hypothetical protein
MFVGNSPEERDLAGEEMGFSLKSAWKTVKRSARNIGRGIEHAVVGQKFGDIVLQQKADGSWSAKLYNGHWKKRPKPENLHWSVVEFSATRPTEKEAAQLARNFADAKDYGVWATYRYPKT